MKPSFLSHASLYTGDYDCIFRNAQHELPIGLHYHDFYEISFYLGDAGNFLIQNQEYPMHAGNVALIRMFEPHTLLYRESSDYERFCISIQPSLLLSYGTPQSNILDIFSTDNKNYPVFSMEECGRERYLNLLEQFRGERPTHGQDLWEKALLHQLLACLYSDCYDGIHLDRTSSRHAALVTQLVDYIHTHLEEDLSLPRLARETGYSEYYLCRIFKQVTSHTLNSYIVEKRIFQAAQLIAGGLPCGHAAQATGFHNYSYFFKAFQRYMGVGPTEYLSQRQS